MKLKTNNLTLFIPEIKDAERLYSFEMKNKEHFRRYSSGDATRESLIKFNNDIISWQSDFMEKRAIKLLMVLNEDARGPIIGQCNLNNIIYGAFRACFLGYRIDKDYENRGLMKEAVIRVIDYAFNELNLHRIMANYMPCNERSANLLQKLGFEKEGYAKKYLKINGRWEDHILTSLINENNQ